MLTLNKLIELALGCDEARKVDTAIPQGVFDSMTQAAKNDIAGWYYAPEVKLMGRLLTQSECWRQIYFRLGQGELKATMMDHDVSWLADTWPCFRSHVERGEIRLEESGK
jgi:hypothetical protein